MKAKSLEVAEGAVYSPAEVHLAQLLRTLKSSYNGDKSDFVRHMTKKVGDLEFSAAEVERIWKAMHSVTFYDQIGDTTITAMDSRHRLIIRHEFYKNNSNFFEGYAHNLLEIGEIVRPRGRQKGFTSPAIQANLAKMRAAKAAKRSGIVHEDIFRVEPSKEEEQKPASNLFVGLSLAELEQAQTELAAAIQNRREEILGLYKSLKGQIGDLERQVSDLEAKNPWLKQL